MSHNYAKIWMDFHVKRARGREQWWTVPEAQPVGTGGRWWWGPPQGRSPASGCSLSRWLAPPAAGSLHWPPWAAWWAPWAAVLGREQDPGVGRAEAGGGSGSRREGRSVRPSHTPVWRLTWASGHASLSPQRFKNIVVNISKPTYLKFWISGFLKRRRLPRLTGDGAATAPCRRGGLSPHHCHRGPHHHVCALVLILGRE